MRLLLDTHTLIWHFEDSPRLSRDAKKAINNEENRLVISVVTVWEVTIKTNLGKLSLDTPIAKITAWHRARGAAILNVTEEHALEVGALPGMHRDPFDRMLVAQARCEGLTLVTGDPWFDDYPVPLLW